MNNSQPSTILRDTTNVDVDNFFHFLKIFLNVFPFTCGQSSTGTISIDISVSRSPTSGFKTMEMKPKWPSRAYTLEIHSDIQANTLHNNLLNYRWIYHFTIFRRYGGLSLRPGGLHPQYPFIHSLSFSSDEEFPMELKWFY